jgi:hypothetical protein
MPVARRQFLKVNPFQVAEDAHNALAFDEFLPLHHHTLISESEFRVRVWVLIAVILLIDILLMLAYFMKYRKYLVVSRQCKELTSDLTAEFVMPSSK